MEKCSKCGAEAPSGALARDTVDAALIFCEKCRPAEKKPAEKIEKAEKPAEKKPRKPRTPRKRKEPEMTPPAAPVFVEPPPIPPEILRKDAEACAIECGLSNVMIHEPVRENYPKYGFGYVVQIVERSGKQRRATLKYTAHGKRSYWQQDGMVTG